MKKTSFCQLIVFATFVVSGCMQSFYFPRNRPVVEDGKIWVLKVDSLGREIWSWTQRWSDTLNSLVFVKPSLDGGCFVVGTAYEHTGCNLYVRDISLDTIGYSLSRFRLLKLDSKGGLVWSKECRGFIKDFCETTNRGLIVAGVDSSIVFAQGVDSTGNRLWLKRYDLGNKFQTVLGIKALSNGNYLLITEIPMSQNIWTFDLRFFEITATGDSVNSFVYNNSRLVWMKPESKDYMTSLIQEGKFFMAFDSATKTIYSYPLADFEYYLESDTFLGLPTRMKEISSVIQLESGNYMVTGTKIKALGDTWGNINLWLALLDDDGNALWEHSYGGRKTDKGTGICLTRDGNYIIIGSKDIFYRRI